MRKKIRLLASRVWNSKNWLLKTILVLIEVVIIMSAIILYNIYVR